MSLRESLSAVWKFCLSFRQGEWELSDYPVIIREQKIDLELGHAAPRFKRQRYSARVVNWWVLNGGGDTSQQAIRNLAVQFGQMRTDWQRRGKPLPRPGTKVPIEFTPSERVHAHPELTDDFIRRMLGLDWCFVIRRFEPLVWGFHTNESNDALHANQDQGDLRSGCLRH